MSTAVIQVVMLVLTVVMVTTADPVVPFLALSNGEQLEQAVENLLKQNAELNQKLEKVEIEMERQKMEMAKQRMEMEKQKSETEKQKVEVEKQKSETEKQKVEVEKQKSETEKQKVEVEKQKSEMEKQNAIITHWTESVRSQAPGGAVYIRWGRTVCEGDAVAVYRGFAGGSFYDSRGGASNTLCLSDSPEWGTYIDGYQIAGAIHGVEYELASINGSPFSTRNNGDMSLANQDAPCVLCHTATRQTQVMIPGKMSCPAGWVMEYWGYLVGGSYNHTSHYRHDYLCVDEAPEPIIGGGSNLDGGLWYPVQAYCGSLPCAPYVGGREVTCVVCSLSAPN